MSIAGLLDHPEPTQKLFAGKEFQYRSNGTNWYKTCVVFADLRIVPGTRSLHIYPEGKKLTKAMQNITEDILNGAWANKLPKKSRPCIAPTELINERMHVFSLFITAFNQLATASDDVPCTDLTNEVAKLCEHLKTLGFRPIWQEIGQYWLLDKIIEVPGHYVIDYRTVGRKYGGLKGPVFHVYFDGSLAETKDFITYNFHRLFPGCRVLHYHRISGSHY